MKVELLVNLKYGSFKIRGKGEVFESPLPSEIQQEVNLCKKNPNRNTVRIIEDSAPIQESKEPEIVQVQEIAKEKPLEESPLQEIAKEEEIAKEKPLEEPIPVQPSKEVKPAKKKLISKKK